MSAAEQDGKPKVPETMGPDRSEYMLRQVLDIYMYPEDIDFVCEALEFHKEPTELLNDLNKKKKPQPFKLSTAGKGFSSVTIIPEDKEELSGY